MIVQIVKHLIKKIRRNEDEIGKRKVIRRQVTVDPAVGGIRFYVII